jgi:hypothetical protein
MAVRAPHDTSATNPKIRERARHSDLIQLSDDHLHWQFGNDVCEVTLEPAAFGKFLELAEAPPEHILAFARRHGPLGLCKHGLPICHGPRQPDPGELVSPPQWPPRYCNHFMRNGERSEPLTSWRALARAAFALLELSASLKEGSRETKNARETWELNWKSAIWLSAQQYGAVHWDCEVEYRFWQLPRAELLRIRPFRHFNQRQLANEVNEWLECGGIYLRASWSKERHLPALDLVADSRCGPNLFGFLALQLAQQWTGGKRIARCPCGKLFSAAPRSSPRRRNFCPDCKPGTVHMAEYRGRIRDALRMSAQGATVAQIAVELGRDPNLIRKWVKGK